MNHGEIKVDTKDQSILINKIIKTKNVCAFIGYVNVPIRNYGAQSLQSNLILNEN